MPVCVVCSAWGEGALCSVCRRGLHRAAPVRLGGSLEVYAAFAHGATARRLVHRLKYTGIRCAAEVLAMAMLEAMPSDVTALVPVPRALARHFRYGVDPAVLLAGLIGREAGIPVVAALRAPLWWPSNAGTSRARRWSPGFRPMQAAPAGGVLVDDVVTTGATLLSAAERTQLHRALTATRAGEPVSG